MSFQRGFNSIIINHIHSCIQSAVPSTDSETLKTVYDNMAQTSDTKSLSAYTIRFALPVEAHSVTLPHAKDAFGITGSLMLYRSKFDGRPCIAIDRTHVLPCRTGLQQLQMKASDVQ
eukprot:6083856-Pyramimonas_sp.AAC.1